MPVWYTSLENEPQIQQGDLIVGCPVLESPANLTEYGQYTVRATTYNVIVMTQSCDLVAQQDGKRRADNVIVCPYFTFDKYFEGRITAAMRADPKVLLNAKNNRIKELAAGKQLGVHILNTESDSGVDEHIVINLRLPYVMKYSLLSQVLKLHNEKRLRLNSPYLEHVSQAFATLYMRVGLPSSVDLIQG
jgi:hypothetical protein